MLKKKKSVIWNWFIDLEVSSVTKIWVAVIALFSTFVSFSLDTEWKPEVVNSRNFDREIGHKNPR